MIDNSHEDIQKIANVSTSVPEFYSGFLQAISTRSNAEIGVAWNCSDSPYSPICQVAKNSDTVARIPLSQENHGALLKSVAADGCPRLVRANGKEVTDATAEVPSILLGPIRRANRTELVEFILPSDNSNELNQEALKFLDSSIKFAETFDENAKPADRPVQLSAESIDEFAINVHHSMDYKKTASVVANEMRRVLDCDRVSVALRQGGRFRLFSISGQPSVNRRSNLVTSMEHLIGRVLKTGKPFWYPTEDPVPPQIEKWLNDYLVASSARSLAIIPVFEKPESQDDSPFEADRTRRGRRKHGLVIGSIVVEQCGEEWVRSSIEPAIDITSRHSAEALRRADQIRSIPLYPVWRTIGQSHLLFSARNLPKTLLAFLGLTLLTLVAIFIPSNFDLHCQGELVPAERRSLYAEVNGSVEKIFVEHGDNVTAGAPLLQMQSQDLDLQLEEVKTQIATLEEKLIGTRSARIHQRDQPEQREQEFLGAMKRQLEGLNSIQEKLLDRRAKLQITSPIDGQVVTWGLNERLEGRPVSQSNLLLEVANVRGQWQLELELPDKKVGHLIRAQKESDEPIEVVFQLAMDPERSLTGQVKKIAGATSLNSQHQQHVRIVVDIDEADIEGLKKVGAGVAAKLRCGRRSIGYVWLHDPIEFVKSEILFRLW